MATAIKASVNNATDYFDLDGLDYEKGLYAFYYDSVEKDTSGVIDESKIRVGLKSKNEIGRNLVQPKLVVNWTDGGVVASGTITAATVLENTFADGTVTCSTVLENTFADGTVTCASVLAADTVTANGLLYTAVSGAKANDTEFSIDTGDNETATDLADSIDSDTRSGTTGDLSAVSASAVVTMTTDVAGTAGNAITLVSSEGTRLAVSGSGTLTGGVDADTVTANGLLYTAVAGTKADNTQFSTDTGNDETATDLADSIDSDTRSGTLGDLSAVSASAVVTMTTDVVGTAGNAVTLVSSDGGTLAVSGSGTLTGGVSADTATVNGLLYTAVAGAKADNTQFSTDTGDDETATDLADSISKDIRVGTLNDVRAVSASAVVTVSSKVPGTGGNAITLVSSDGTTLAVSGALFTGGVNAVAFSDFDTFIAAASILISE